MKKTFLLVIFALLTGLASFSQDNVPKGSPNNGFDPYWYLNLNIGRNLLYGDFKSTPVNINAIGKQTGFLGGIFGGRQFSPVFGLRGLVDGGTMKSRVDENVLYHFKAKTHFFGYYLEPTFDFTNMIDYNPDRKYSLYGYTGLGMVKMYTELNNYTTNTQTIVSKNGGTEFRDWTNSAVIPYGVGAKYKFDDNWGVNLEVGSFYSLNKTKGDQLDGKVQGEHRDWIGNFTIGVNYDFVSGANLKRMAANYNMIKYTVIPNPLEMRNDSIVITVKGTVPEKYFAKKGAILITPTLKYNGGVYPLTPITLKGEEVNGPGTAIPYKTGGTFQFQQTIPYLPGMSASDLMVDPIIYKPAAGLIDPNETAQQIQAKDKFIDIPEHKIGDGVIITSTLIIHDEDLLMAADKLVKEKFATKDALIYFAISKYNLNWKLDLNKKNVTAITELNTFINKGWLIKSIDVDGYASPDGEESFNQALSANRAVTGKQYVIDLFKKWSDDKDATEFQKTLSGVTINTASHGEDWDGFMLSVQASDMKEKAAILNIVNTQSDFDKRNHEIRNMTHVFKYLANDILPSLRRVNIKVNSYEPVKTDAEFLNAATTSPETLTVEELLYSATLTKDRNVQLSIYKATMAQNKDDWRAYNNAAVIELMNGNSNQALSYLNTANMLAPNNVIILNNMGAVQAQKGNINASLELFQKAKGLGANETYNMGIPLITRGKYDEAANTLSIKKCNHNLGLAQLLNGNTQAAIATLKCAPAVADNYYLLAIAGARTNDTALMYDNLTNAVKMDVSFKLKAAGDREFIRYFNTPEFQAIVK
jgi:outer membrane protein OmpA-like peptidoglycan-associated protein